MVGKSLGAGHLELIDETLAQQVRNGLGVDEPVEKIAPARKPIDLKESPALRLYGRYDNTLAGRKVGLLLGTGFDAERKKALIAAITREKAKLAIVASKIQGEVDGDGTSHPADMALRASPSVLFDAVAILAGSEGDKTLGRNPDAISFLMDAHRHCKEVAWSGIPTLCGKAGVEEGAGIINLDDKSGVKQFVKAAKEGRFWNREGDFDPVAHSVKRERRAS